MTLAKLSLNTEYIIDRSYFIVAHIIGSRIAHSLRLSMNTRSIDLIKICNVLCFT